MADQNLLHPVFRLAAANFDYRLLEVADQSLTNSRLVTNCFHKYVGSRILQLCCDLLMTDQ